MKNLILIITLLIIFSSCSKKDDPVTVIEQPVFYAKGTINNQPLNINAGVDDYYMYSDFTYGNTDSVTSFNATLRKSNCASCFNVLHLSIRNHAQTLPQQTIYSDSAFTNNYYSYKSSGGTPYQYLMTFNGIDGEGGGNIVQNYKWIFGDGTTSNVENPQHIYQHPGAYYAGFIVNYINGCSDTVINLFRIGIPGMACRAILGLPTVNGLQVSFQNNSVGIGALTYQWTFGDGSTSTLQNPVHTYASQGIYKVMMIVTDAQQHHSEFNFHVPAGIPFGCLATYQYPQLTSIPNNNALSNIEVEWTDENGVLFSSVNGLQPDESFFQIISVDDYANNANNQKTKKLHVKLNCTLRNSSGTAIKLENAEAVIAVAYQ